MEKMGKKRFWLLDGKKRNPTFRKNERLGGFVKPIYKQILISIASAVAGGLIVFGIIKFGPGSHSKMERQHTARQSHEDLFDDIFKKQDGIRSQFDNIFNEDFFGQGDPFDQMRKMREQMEKRMEGLNSRQQGFGNPFDSWFSEKFGGGTINDISKREDESWVYYDIKVEDLSSTSINTNVENGYVTITGTTEKESGSDAKEGDNFSAQTVYKSTFNRTFPLPDHVDSKKMELTSEKDKIILKFPKTEVSENF